MNLRYVDFVGTQLALIDEDLVRRHLSVADALVDLRLILGATMPGDLVTRPRVRVVPRGGAWLHTLRGGLGQLGIVGGKDYSSIGFETPAVWVTVLDTESGLPLALIEADYLSRIRTAAVTALATDMLAPVDATCLVHFGAGKISSLLVHAIVEVSELMAVAVRKRPTD